MYKISLAKRWLTTINLILVVSSLNFIISCNNPERRMKSQAEDLFGVIIPNDAFEIQYEKIFVSSEFSTPYYAYLQMEISENDYLVLLQQMEVAIQVAKNNPLLVMDRLQPNRLSPDWWTPPDNAGDIYATGEFVASQNGGWIVSTYHNGIAYIKAREDSRP